jgi:hypothetical protein
VAWNCCPSDSLGIAGSLLGAPARAGYARHRARRQIQTGNKGIVYRPPQQGTPSR